MDKTETIVQLKKLLASKKAADLLKALKKLQRNYFPEFGNTVVDIFALLSRLEIIGPEKAWI